MFVALLGGVSAAAADAGGGSSNGLMEAFKENPTFLSINLVVSAIVIAIVIERTAFQLGKYRVNSKEFFAQIKKLVTAGNIDRAIKLCDARLPDAPARQGRPHPREQGARRNRRRDER